ncbi:MAG TPA: DNA-processing protein DprA [Actinomycetota bacterium]|jgi:DNA processing protein|nr:DNA-processing protein DprA [Actinomycetota bacterium]
MSRLLDRFDPEWPACLNELGPWPSPRQLYLRGRPLDAEKTHVAIVGTRRPTRAGLEIAERFARELSEAGFVIVSGLALGIDTAAHRAALKAGGWTIAVLGCGVDVAYPARNERLQNEIAAKGTVLSEYPDGTGSTTWQFPERNRIIAGLCKGVIVVEGGKKSGALITASRALDSNRAVFAIPGSIRNPMAVTPNELIRTSQATLVTKPRHVFEDLAPGLVWKGHSTDPLAPRQPELEALEQRVLELLDDAPTPADRIRRDLEEASGAVALALSCLEVRGLARKKTAGYEITGAGVRVREALLAPPMRPVLISIDSSN